MFLGNYKPELKTQITMSHSFSLANPDQNSLNTGQKISSAIGIIGLFLLFLLWYGSSSAQPISVGASLALMIAGVLGYAWSTYASTPNGVKNNHVWQRGLTARGLSAWLIGILLTTFYVLLYWYPAMLGLADSGAANTGLVSLFDPLSRWFKGQPASQWFVYGVLYTLAIVVFGLKFIWKYRGNRYQQFRTMSVIFFQAGFAFILPEIMQGLHLPYNDFKNMWPLNYYFFDEWHVKELTSSGNIGLFMLVFGIAMMVVVSPVLTYFYGKRWYCSWVCGCGGLAETAGDPFRQLSDKSTKAWKIERWLIHSVLVFALVMTVAVLFTLFQNNGDAFWIGKTLFVGIMTLILGVGGWLLWRNPKLINGLDPTARRIGLWTVGILLGLLWVAYVTGSSNILFFISSYQLRDWYGFFIGAAFSGVVGVGFYPIFGSRVWCRFGCPMAAILGLQQKIFSRFRITTNGGQCISCGNCSTYCEMGIDVRSYAQKGQNIVRSSCVGCGVCSAVCPRGVLRLENADEDIFERTTEQKVIQFIGGNPVIR